MIDTGDYSKTPNRARWTSIENPQPNPWCAGCSGRVRILKAFGWIEFSGGAL
jgi:hypothetical protein